MNETDYDAITARLIVIESVLPLLIAGSVHAAAIIEGLEISPDPVDGLGNSNLSRDVDAKRQHLARSSRRILSAMNTHLAAALVSATNKAQT